MSSLMEALTGTWKGTGRGEYPTIEPFTYHEQISLLPLADKPILAYTQRTRSPEGNPLHAEAGFYRFGQAGVELVIAQPTGIAESHRGKVTDSRIEFEQTGLALTPTAVEVKEVRRIIEVNGNRMTYRLDMAAVGQPLVVHLEATVERVASSG